MQNALSCMIGNQTLEYFGWDPLSIQEYFSYLLLLILLHKHYKKHLL